MRRERLRIEEFLRGELSAEEAERVAELLEQEADAQADAEWLERLRTLAAGARTTPPDDVVSRLEARLLALPERIEAGEVKPPIRVTTRERAFRVPPWLAYPAPLVRVAATLLVGLLVGYGIWGTGTDPALRQPTDLDRPAMSEMEAPAAEVTFAGSGATSARMSTVQELEARVEALERAILQTYFSRVEATMLHFVTGAAEGDVVSPASGNTRDLLSVTANLKAEHKTTNDVRMTRLLGQIETVLMEMDRLSRERDLSGARHVASVIAEQGLLSTLQRLKVGVEE